MIDNPSVASGDRSKSGPTRKREEAEEKPKEGFLEAYGKIIKKITYPSKSQWWSTLWRVSLILIVFGAILFVVDYLLLNGVLKLQVAMSPLGIRWIEIVYSVLLFMTGAIATISILSTTGGTEGGLSSMLGSSVQYGDITGSFGKRISKTTFISSGLLMAMCLLAPLFLGGI